MPEFENHELAGPYYREVYKARLERYGPHPTCAGCLKQNICMVAAVPGYEFTCNERMMIESGRAKAEEKPIPVVWRRKRKRGGWG